MIVKNHITIVRGASTLGDRSLALVDEVILLVNNSHRVRNALEKVKLDNELAATFGLDDDNATEVYNLLRALDVALENVIVTNVTHRLG